jgi:uncharacterized YigZ family protein
VAAAEVLRVAAGSAEAEHRVKGSRFIAVSYPAAGLEQAAGFRDGERRRFHDASHHVYAVLLRSGEDRFDDDGEPAGSAGRPTLGAIQRSGLNDVAVIVTRYFGGTKLGTGGLGRAYAAAAALALAETPFRTVVPGKRMLITYAYDDTGAVVRSLESVGGRRVREAYGDVAELEVAIPTRDVARLRAVVTEATAGRAKFVDLPGETLLPVDT